MPNMPWRLPPIILMYHCVDDDSFDPWGLSVSPANFEAQMGWLSRNRNVLPLAEFARLHRDRSLADGSVAITFDDGYLSFADTAAPILERLRLPATIFLPAALIGSRREFWWDRLARVILGSTAERLSVLGRSVELGEPSASERHWRPSHAPSSPRQTLFIETWAAIRTLPPEEVDRVIDEIESRSGGGEPVPAKTLMTAGQARSLNSAIVQVGSHALTHPSLPALSTDAKRQEICGSIDRCAELTGEIPDTFAYPFGDFDEESRTIVEDCGFACGCTTQRRPVARRDRLSALPRVGVGNWPVEVMSRVLREI